MDNGGPAFPRNPGDGGNKFGGEVWLRNTGQLQEGMSLRDWFAGQALVGVLLKSQGMGAAHAAGASFEIADAMLAERERGE